MKKIPRLPRQKKGVLELSYGRLEKGENPDVVYTCGEGCDRADLRLLHYHFSWGRLKIGREQEPSLVEDLIKRGYDISTIKFSIKKKEI